MKISVNYLMRLNLALALSLGVGGPLACATAYARAADSAADLYTVELATANNVSNTGKIAQTARITGQLNVVNGNIELTDKSTGRTYRIDDQNGAAMKAYNAGNRRVSIEGTKSGNATITAETVNTL